MVKLAKFKGYEWEVVRKTFWFKTIDMVKSGVPFSFTNGNFSSEFCIADC